MKSAFLTTCEQMLRENLPNFLRLYCNPHVAQVCFCLNNYVRTTWGTSGDFQSFLANSFEEALSGAIKLARYDRSVARLPTTGLVVDGCGRLAPNGSGWRRTGQMDYLPGIKVVDKDGDLVTLTEQQNIGFVVLMCFEGFVDLNLDWLNRFRKPRPLLIMCLDRISLSQLRCELSHWRRRFEPDIVVFDESFVNHDVPFGAFTARKALYDHWNRPSKTGFHSTTFQPNTVASLHFMRCLESVDPDFYGLYAGEFQRVLTDRAYRNRIFRDLYSPSLYRMACASGFDSQAIWARGNFVHVGNRQVFDAVSGVACSVRGHNPPSYVNDLFRLDGLNAADALAARLCELTGLEHMVPAVSGAGAVENALRLALVAQFPRTHVLALKAGFGGKTLLALTCTAASTYKEHVAPLYDAVSYVDPFAQDALAQIETVLARHPVAVVHVELVQAVGGVRQLPESVSRFLDARRRQAGYFLLIDEVQTGMYRTGAISMSQTLGLSPDLLLLGKATSDMMFPFALILYSNVVHEKLHEAGSDLAAVLRKRYGYELGYKTVYNVLHLAKSTDLPQRVLSAAALFQQLLRKGLAECQAVQEVRVFGLLIGIELNVHRWPQRLLRKRLYALYLLALLHHSRYPVMAGFCQCEPNVLKITPALTIEPQEIHNVCATIIETLCQPFHRLVRSAMVSWLRPERLWRTKHEHRSEPANRLVAH